MGGLPVKPKLQGYVAQELFDEFEAYRASHNLNQSKALEKLLAEYFGKPSAPTLPPNDALATSALASLRAELAALRLELVQRLEVVESRLANKSAANLGGISAIAEDVIAVPVTVSAIRSADESATLLDEVVDRLADESASESLVVNGSEEEAVVVEAIAPFSEPQHLTQQQLAKRLGVSRQYVAKLEKSGKLAEIGWEPVPGTGGRKNPRRYRPISR